MFDIDEYTLKTKAREELNKVAEKIKGYPDSKIVIHGHTDNTGSSEHNRTLSENRAGAVRDFFLAMDALKNFDIGIIGHGESDPIASNDAEAGREKNRRVEIVIIPK